MKHYFDICEHGACPDGKTINTKAIQEAIDACHQAGGGRVLCGPGVFMTGSLELKSNVDLHLMPGCRIVGSPADYTDFAASGFGFMENGLLGKSPPCLIGAADADNIAITGPGEINGSGLAFYDLGKTDANGHLYVPPRRPRIAMFSNCRRVRLEDASFIDAAFWTFWLRECRDVNIHRIKIRCDIRMCAVDGIDIDSCRNVAVSDCFFETEDDCLAVRAIRAAHGTPAVCENISVNNCVLDSRCNGIRIGCPGDGVIRNCTFSNLVINNSLNNGILFEYPARYLPADGRTPADVHDILFSNIVVNCARWPVKIIVEDGIKLSRLADLSFAHFRIKSGGPCLVQGSPETIIRNVSFSDMAVETTGADAVICRNCQGVKLVNVELANLDRARESA